jgi:hypothetical protein
MTSHVTPVCLHGAKVRDHMAFAGDRVTVPELTVAFFGERPAPKPKCHE